MEKVYIYTLEDPITSEVRYVGKANNIQQRYKSHLNKARKHQIHKKNWIKSLKNKKLKPIVEVIDIVPIEEWIFWETYWISQIKAWGFNLINYTNGGDGCTFGNQTSFKKGQNAKNILCLSKEGNIINTFLGIKECELFCGKKGIGGVLLKKRKTAGGYLWIYKSDFDNMNEVEKENYISWANNKKRIANSGSFKSGNTPANLGKKGYKLTGLKTAKTIVKLDLNHNVLKMYSSIKEASLELNCNPESIRRACVNNKKFCDFFWKYKNNF